MYQPLVQLEDLNVKCRIHLTKLLSSRHGIGIASTDAGNPEAISRGSAFFAAYDPWDTCWRVPPGSMGYFDIAERTGLVGAADAFLLSRTLLHHGAELSTVYDGWFSSFFREPSIKTILGEATWWHPDWR